MDYRVGGGGRVGSDNSFGVISPHSLHLPSSSFSQYPHLGQRQGLVISPPVCFKLMRCMSKVVKFVVRQF